MSISGYQIIICFLVFTGQTTSGMIARQSFLSQLMKDLSANPISFNLLVCGHGRLCSPLSAVCESDVFSSFVYYIPVLAYIHRVGIVKYLSSQDSPHKSGTGAQVMQLPVYPRSTMRTQCSIGVLVIYFTIYIITL